MNYVGIDPSTKTGVVVLDKDGEIINAVEIAPGGKDPARMCDIIDAVNEEIVLGDRVAIEGFGFASMQAILMGGIGWGLRMRLFERSIKYSEVAPAALKKFAGGKGNAKKDELAVDIFKRWGFEHKSDNVRDAYVLARIVYSLDHPSGLTAAQAEVINTIQHPPVKVRKRQK